VILSKALDFVNYYRLSLLIFVAYLLFTMCNFLKITTDIWLQES